MNMMQYENDYHQIIRSITKVISNIIYIYIFPVTSSKDILRKRRLFEAYEGDEVMITQAGLS